MRDRRIVASMDLDPCEKVAGGGALKLAGIVVKHGRSRRIERWYFQ